MNILSFQNVSKYYNDEKNGLHNVSFSVQSGEFLALAGPSGSGKTTVLNIAAGLDGLSDGEVFLLNYRLHDLDKAILLDLRRKQVGFIFQSYNLFPVLNAQENIEYPLALRKIKPAERRKQSSQMLAEVGLSGFEKRLASQLSAGQQQRVAIARAMITCPPIVFADEPTANLDASTAEKLLALFRRLNRVNGTTFIFSSHDPRVLHMADRVIELCDGKIQSDSTVLLGSMPLGVRKRDYRSQQLLQ